MNAVNCLELFLRGLQMTEKLSVIILFLYRKIKFKRTIFPLIAKLYYLSDFGFSYMVLLLGLKTRGIFATI